jgi:pilus assembly protein TadC
MEENVLYTVGRSIIPKRFRPDLRTYLTKVGYDDVPYSFFGVLFFCSSALAYFLYIFFFYPELKTDFSAGIGAILQFGFLTFITFAIIMFLILFSTGAVVYFYWNIRLYNRTKELESLLPDYLTLVSTNLKGGMSFENALWNAIKPEFGILANEVGLVSKRVMTGNDVADALVEFSLKYESPILRRNIQLMISEVESGGKIVETIDKIIIDMKKTELIKKEMASSTVTYMIFIGMLVVLICPVLFALSLQLFTIISGFITNLAGSVTPGSTGLTIGAPKVTVEDFKKFSIAAITIISIFSSLIVAIIEKGDIRSGIKYIPLFLITSMTIYFIALLLLQGLFGSIAV